MKFQPPKGTRDLPPEEAKRYETFLELFRRTAERCGFLPLDTPAFESFELLAAKGGLGEAVRDEIYYFKDKGERELGLRFDLTVPLARFFTNNPSLPKPFKRYQTGKVWRYDNPQAMRWREFWQADVDIIGSGSMLADVECLAVAVDCLKSIGFKDFTIRLNNRKLMEYLFERVGVPKAKILEVFKAVDKLDKLGEEKVRNELDAASVNSDPIFKILKSKGSNEDLLAKVRKEYGNCDGLKELESLLGFAAQLGIADFIRIDLDLMRGLEYYTGPVFELALGKSKVSCGGGGRYDNLVKLYGGPDSPATGFSLGIDRVMAVATEEGLLQAQVAAKVFVASVNDEVRREVMGIAARLRAAGISADYDISERKLSKQMEYASSLKIPYVIVIGPEELKSKSAKLRDMLSGKERQIKLAELATLKL